MGFLDKLKKAANTVTDFLDDGQINGSNKVGTTAPAFNNNNPSPKSNFSNSQTTVNSNKSLTIKKLIDSGKISAKPSREIMDVLYDTKPDGTDAEIEYTFNLSGDFIESQSHAAEIEILYAYAPEYDEDFISDSEIVDDGYPYFFISSGDDIIYNAVNSFKTNGSIDNAYFCEKIKEEKMLFKAKINYFNNIAYFYGCDRGYSWNNMGIGVIYKKEIMNTDLEKKLIAAVDEAALTYKENI